MSWFITTIGPMTPEITSASNPRMKRLIGLKERSRRDQEGVFVVEGHRLFSRAVEAGLTPIEIYHDGTVPIEVDPATKAWTVAPAVLDRISYRSASEGVVAVFEQFDTDLSAIRLGETPLVLALENIEKPGNLGAALRTADAVGADLVAVLGSTVDRFNPNVLRSSTGAVFTVPVVTCEWDQLAHWLTEHHISLIAADPEASQSLWQTRLDAGVALVVGAESAGLSDQARALANLTVSIPMRGASDSLNASVALAVVAFEALRQRSA